MGEIREPLYEILLIIVAIFLIFVIPLTNADQAETLTEFVSELLSPIGLLHVIRSLALSFGLLLVILFISIIVSANFPTGRQYNEYQEYDEYHRDRGSLVGYALLLLLVLFLLYNRFSIFGGNDSTIN